MEIVNRLIRAGGEVNAPDKLYGYTPLHFASVKGHVEVVNRLIHAGGDVNKKQHGTGRVPLHWASVNGQVEVITALLVAGADNTIKTRYGKTPHNVAKNQATRNALLK